ncbi:ABC transporter ATP-binding protein [Rhodoligotrophos defluvii]|uniref:ABC transporter ATP-binding protein n=1 Tax=Rhodoligotrophos defluvii TaxID=2561934 RepID=UPI003083F64D
MSIQGVSRAYGNVLAVDDVTLEVAASEFLSLLGPSGSGKTTLLMMLAGFEAPTKGRLVVGEQDLTNVPPNKRNIGMVFQKYALFPHKTVADNIVFPLRMRGVNKADREAKVRQALDMVRLSGYEGRMPSQLSGGQQQRVALARAIVFDPPVILMDEPLGALDKKLRQHLQLEIKQLQQRLGATVIYVTHDQEEALTMSDRIAVLDHGKLLQLGRPTDLYNHPANAFVADFLGEMNFLPGTVERVRIEHCDVSIGGNIISACTPAGTSLPPGDPVRVAIRPERLAVTAGQQQSQCSGLAGEVSQLVFNGATMAILIKLDHGPTVRASISAQSHLSGLRPGDAVTVGWSAGDAFAYPGAGK